jgi:hypothetical protein
MWQGGLAAGKPSVPWYQIHVRGIPGWRACRRPQARPPRFVQGNNGERSLGPAPGEAAAMQRRMCRPAVDLNADHHHDHDASTRRSYAPFALGDASVAGRFRRRLAWAPEGTRCLAAGSDVCGMRSREALHGSVSAARKGRASFRCWATCSINRTLTLPGHEEGPKKPSRDLVFGGAPKVE